MYRQIAQGNRVVIRRVGGLEESEQRHPRCRNVIRRVGGLEVAAFHAELGTQVIRRVGGLEVRLHPFGEHAGLTRRTIWHSLARDLADP